MILATHGRAIWILDNLAPIQEYAAAQTATADAKLFTPPPTAMYRRPARDRNYEFWGDQTFFGENPPQAAVISWYLKKQVERRPAEDHRRRRQGSARDLRSRCSPTATKPGIQSACWDLRVQPGADTGGWRRGGPERQGRRSARTSGRTRWRRAGRRIRSAPAAAVPVAAAAAGSAAPAAGTRAPSCCRGPTPSRSSSTARPSTASRCASLADPEVVLTEGRTQEDVRHGDGDARAAAARAPTSAPAWDRSTRVSAELTKEAASKTDVPRDLKASRRDVAEGRRGARAEADGAGVRGPWMAVVAAAAAARETASSRESVRPRPA